MWHEINPKFQEEGMFKKYLTFFLSIPLNILPWCRHYGYLDPTLASRAKESSVTAQLSASGLEGGSPGLQHYQKFEEKEKGIMTETSFSSSRKEVDQIVTRTSATTTTTSFSKFDVARTESKWWTWRLLSNNSLLFCL